ncbi:ROK family protein [Oscillibacter sp.]|uniref:ROK family protein n=1 Tax=Oscillibacter sp. TaxID=1945593 RepID=UPI00261B972F|nr:ROK family protein [Oscillibacter sp.]MDD3346496.1 ROK family protein [Oscillibacter sp.]
MYIGIDVGGTNLKAGLVSESGAILAAERTPLVFHGAEDFAKTLAALAGAVLEKGGAAPGEIAYVGIGIPGAVAEGKICYTCNIPLQNVPLSDLFRKYLDLPVLLENDANCAAVGEWLCGAGRGTEQFAIVTLGTGVGGGFILNGKLYAGSGMVGEVGHMVVEKDGAPCNCGRRGCWEAYASATGLIRMTRETMARHPESLLHRLAEKDGVEGRTAFLAAQQGDCAAKALCRTYVDYLACGVTNLVNILQPEAVAIGGGVAGAPEALLMEPLRQIVERECYPRHTGKLPRILRAELGNDAGIIGAALLGRAL